MPTFVYTARDESGAAASGTLVAATIAEVGKMLRTEGKYPVSVRPSNSSAASDGPGASAGTASSGIHISRADLIQFSTQLAIMVETGVTLAEALDCIGQQVSKPNVKRLVDDLSITVQSGTDLSTALSRHPRSFPRLYVALIRAAEKSGMLSTLLRRATAYLRDEQETLRRVKGALIYPAIMFGFALTTTVFLLAFVLPKFTVIYANKGAALPGPTRILMAMSNALINHWPSIVLGIGAMACGWYFYIRTTTGRAAWHSLQLNIPLIGAMLRKLHLSRSMRMIGTMASSGINLVDCVATANDLCGNDLYRRMWADVSSRIQSGKPMADALAATPLVPRAVAQMIHSGERGGKLAHVMEQVAAFSEQELKDTIAELTRYIEPAMIVIMGFIIGGVALALMLPIFTISRVVAH